jgi:5'-nucleotidase (lipoprotein e(P4) family)
VKSPFAVRAALLILVFAVGRGDAAIQTAPSAQVRPHGQRQAVPAAALQMDDGDTVSIRWSAADVETVRILGIDAPEIRHFEHDLPYDQPFGRDAAAFARARFTRATKIEILRASTLDPYGRTLAYLFIDGRNYSLDILAARLAIESVSAFGDNGFPVEAAAALAAAKQAGPVAFEPPHVYRARMRTVATWLKGQNQYPPPPDPAPDSVRWVRESAEYRAAVLQTYRNVQAHIEDASRTRTAGRWAVIFDADETLIDNSRYQLDRAGIGEGFSPASWDAWVKRREAVALPGAADLLGRIRNLGGRIAIVTNRLGSQCDDTAAVFASEKLVYDAMLCRPDGAASDKNGRFADIAAGRSAAGATPLEVLAFVGDNILDFPGLTQATSRQPRQGFAEFGGRFFVIPNPMYGSWQTP